MVKGKARQQLSETLLVRTFRIGADIKPQAHGGPSGATCGLHDRVTKSVGENTQPDRGICRDVRRAWYVGRGGGGRGGACRGRRLRSVSKQVRKRFGWLGGGETERYGRCNRKR